MAKSETLESAETSVEKFFGAIADETVRQDCLKIADLMEKAIGAAPRMYGAKIVGFGKASGEAEKQSNWMEIGFSPRKQNLTLYLMNIEALDAQALAQLGKYGIGKGCLYFKRLSDVDEKILKKLIEEAVKNIRRV